MQSSSKPTLLQAICVTEAHTSPAALKLCQIMNACRWHGDCDSKNPFMLFQSWVKCSEFLQIEPLISFPLTSKLPPAEVGNLNYN